MRFIHTADWQLGKPFGRFDADTRAALTEARFDAIDAIGRAAVEQGAGHVLVAGDVFDTEGPDDRTIVQAVTRMARHDCRWWLLPGNHDFARNGGLWDRVRRRGAGNVTVLAEARPHEIEDGAWLLPAPLIHRHTLDDPTQAFERMETPGARLRIGVGHGSIRDFGTQGEAKNLIAPDRARRSNLDYLALGDWHGMLTVDARTWYSGTPETDRFGRDEPGHCLVVDAQPGAAPVVTPLRTGRFQWLTRDWTVADAVGFSALCGDLLAGCEPAATLLQLSLAGIVPLTDRVAMLRRIEDDLMHQLRHLDVRDADVVARPSEDDLAALSTEGMLGRAGAMLRERIEANGPDAQRARRALERLFVEALREETLAGENAA
ncbi:metallophosphoesterase [Novosphingobium barchaimii LL02]|uniref:Metallophosphoesterase n=1 Tax=Novosphingobium barchaimii LL02 TaxID=1114963 RepID=A0A0J7XWZ4_9SPHN|nr:DNA repair exonuclease [Novosphingobium barchaimii]KMS56236.1 metallophosphoesterase [Novosphingobium barchaimii LL02]